MAGVERAKKALWSLLRSYNARGSAKLTVTTAKGKLKVILEESFDVQPTAVKAPKRPSPSQIRRKERRAADPAVQQRAAQHQARAAATKTGEVLASPEEERASFAGRRGGLPTLLSNSEQLSIKLELHPWKLEKSWQALKRSEPAQPSIPSRQAL